jgi:ABC-2 type transport system permease protein
MALYALVIVFLYPEFKDTTSLNQLTKHGSTAAALFGITGSLTSPPGWCQSVRQLPSAPPRSQAGLQP